MYSDYDDSECDDCYDSEDEQDYDGGKFAKGKKMSMAMKLKLYRGKNRARRARGEKPIKMNASLKAYVKKGKKPATKKKTATKKKAAPKKKATGRKRSAESILKAKNTRMRKKADIRVGFDETRPAEGFVYNDPKFEVDEFADDMPDFSGVSKTELNKLKRKIAKSDYSSIPSKAADSIKDLVKAEVKAIFKEKKAKALAKAEGVYNPLDFKPRDKYERRADIEEAKYEEDDPDVIEAQEEEKRSLARQVIDFLKPTRVEKYEEQQVDVRDDPMFAVIDENDDDIPFLDADDGNYINPIVGSGLSYLGSGAKHMEYQDRIREYMSLNNNTSYKASKKALAKLDFKNRIKEHMKKHKLSYKESKKALEAKVKTASKVKAKSAKAQGVKVGPLTVGEFFYYDRMMKKYKKLPRKLVLKMHKAMGLKTGAKKENKVLVEEMLSGGAWWSGLAALAEKALPFVVDQVGNLIEGAQESGRQKDIRTKYLMDRMQSGEYLKDIEAMSRGEKRDGDYFTRNFEPEYAKGRKGGSLFGYDSHYNNRIF
jgi:hypothetical protein